MENENTFKLCITMAGAVSAGAYTAGVLDYLIETLDLWEKARKKTENLELPIQTTTTPSQCTKWKLT